METITKLINAECTDTTHEHRTAPDPEPWARFPDQDGGPRFAHGDSGYLYWYPRDFIICDHTAQYWEI